MKKKHGGGKTDKLSDLSKTEEGWNLKTSLLLFSFRLAREEHMAARNGRTDGRAGSLPFSTRVLYILPSPSCSHGFYSFWLLQPLLFFSMKLTRKSPES